LVLLMYWIDDVWYHDVAAYGYGFVLHFDV